MNGSSLDVKFKIASNIIVTVVDSTDGSKYEASTQEPLTPGRDKEDTYPTKNIRPTVIPNLFPEIERDPGRKPTPPATSKNNNFQSFTLLLDFS